MFSLFISFDILISQMNQFMLWFLMIFFFFFFINNFYINTNYILYFLFNSFMKELNVASKLKSNFNLKIFLVFFMFIFITNFLGMWPYSFTMSSQLNYCFFFSFMFWIMILFNNLFNNFNLYFSHLVPSGSPIALSQFMVLIETISQIIRPLTLGVRLMANMTAGHLIMILCSGSFFFLSYVTIPLFLLIILEFMVALVQSYVFIILSSMYLGEFNS